MMFHTQKVAPYSDRFLTLTSSENWTQIRQRHNTQLLDIGEKDWIISEFVSYNFRLHPITNFLNNEVGSLHCNSGQPSSILGKGKRFFSSPERLDRLWDSASLLQIEYQK
jgi:hypothetical protein